MQIFVKTIKKGVKNTINFTNGKIVVTYPNSLITEYIMPEIIDVKTIENDGKVKGIIVYFADGTSEKAILNKDDTYNLEYGISICVTKRLLSGKCNGCGSSIYNKIIRHGLKVYKNVQDKALKDAEEAERIKNKREKIANKKAAKRREYLINIQKEAYIRAMKEINSSS